MVSSTEKAGVLIDALPYMQKFFGKTIVIKYGGNAMLDENLKVKVIEDIILMKYVGMKPVIVHGGGPAISDYMKKFGKQPEFVSGLRVTDAETVGIAEMVLVGKINTEIVSMLNRYGSLAIGLNGKDCDLIVAKKHFAQVYEEDKVKEVDIGFVGKVAKINISILNTLLGNSYIPVIAPTAIGLKGETFNINADYVSAEIAISLGAEKLVLLTDVEGVYKNYQEKSSFISTLTLTQAQQMIKAGNISCGMLPKIEACIAALVGGVAKTHILDGRQSHSLLLELFTKHGVGTEVIPEKRRS